MAQVEIYSSPFCGYCYKAKSIFKKKGVAFVEHDVFTDTAKQDELEKRSPGRTSLPQIFIDGARIGGCDDLMALDREGKLNPMLGIAA